MTREEALTILRCIVADKPGRKLTAFERTMLDVYIISIEAIDESLRRESHGR